MRAKLSIFLAALMVSCLGALHASASLVANDDASQAAYNDGWSSGDNGGSGFQAWSTIGNGGGSGAGGVFIGSSGDINVAGESFGVFGNGGGIGQAVRPFTGNLLVGQTFSLQMDNQGVDNGSAVGFGLQNSSGENLLEFFFLGGGSNYVVSADSASGSTPGFTFDGLELSFTLTDSDSYELSIETLADSVVSTVTGDLFSPGGGQGVAQVRLFNGNGGPDVFFNSLSISAVPEVSPALALPLLLGGVFAVRALRHRPARTGDLG